MRRINRMSKQDTLKTLPSSKAKIEALPRAAPGQRDTYHDDKVPGLQLRVTMTGAKSWGLRKRVGSRMERLTLGSFPKMTIEQARTKAQELNGVLAMGANPAASKRAAKAILEAEPTFSEVFEEFILKHRGKRNKLPLGLGTIKNYRGLVNLYMPGFLDKKLSLLTSEEVFRIHRSIKSPSQQNLFKAVIASVFVFGRKAKMTDLPNPITEEIEINHIASRERFVQPHEMPRLIRSIKDHPLGDFFILCLLTGARRDNVQTMRWADIDLDNGLWHVARTKNGTSQVVTLAPPAVELLCRRKAKIHDTILMEQQGFGVTKRSAPIWVFPSRAVRPSASGHLVEPKRAWANILKAAGLEEHVRIHDLRRTLGSWMAIQGTSLPVIGKSLNHKTSQATEVYARVSVAPVREAVDSAVQNMLTAAEVNDDSV